MIGAQTQVTGANGTYRFPAVPPGAYTVTFELAGFNTFKREGIQIALGFNATVNAELAVATLQETVTVTGASPVIDTSATSVQQNFKLEQLNNIPNGRDMWALLAATPGVVMNNIDVGGNRAGTQTGYRAYGLSGQVRVSVEGINTTEGTGGAGFYFDYGSFEEVFLGVAGQGAEAATPGVQSQFLGKSGGNRFSGEFYQDFYNNAMQALEPRRRSDRRRRPRGQQRSRPLLRHEHEPGRADQAGQGLVPLLVAQAVQRGREHPVQLRQDLRHLEHQPVGEGDLPGQPEPQGDRLLPVEHEDAAESPAARHLLLRQRGPDRPPGITELGLQGRVERHAQQQPLRRGALRRFRLLRSPPRQQRRAVLLARQRHAATDGRARPEPDRPRPQADDRRRHLLHRHQARLAHPQAGRRALLRVAVERAPAERRWQHRAHLRQRPSRARWSSASRRRSR